jgi:hypothetical protein
MDKVDQSGQAGMKIVQAPFTLTEDQRERAMEAFLAWRADNHDGVVESCGAIDIDALVSVIRNI